MSENERALHPELAARGSFAHLKLGKRPRKNDPRTLRLAKYLTPEATYPDHVDWTAAVSSWPMYGNDHLSDCTFAAAGHMVQAWTANASAPATPTEDEVIAAYWATGSDDTGRYELDVLNYWRTQGIAGHEILAYVAIDPKNLDHVRYAIATFGGVYVGVGLPISAQGQAEWTVVGDGQTGASAPGSWGGHAIDYVAYDSGSPGADDGSLICITWGAPLRVADPFHLAYCDEVYAIVTKDWVAANGQSPTGLDLDALLADLHVVEQAETPANITIGEPDDGGGFRVTMPTLPYEIHLNDATCWIQPYPDGTVSLKFAPVQTIPGRGAFPIPPGVEIKFGADGWANFKERVAADGAQTPTVPPPPPPPPAAARIVRV